MYSWNCCAPARGPAHTLLNRSRRLARFVIAQIFNLPFRRVALCRDYENRKIGHSRHPADFKSAIQQIKNLRYEQGAKHIRSRQLRRVSFRFQTALEIVGELKLLTGRYLQETCHEVANRFLEIKKCSRAEALKCLNTKLKKFPDSWLGICKGRARAGLRKTQDGSKMKTIALIAL